MSPQGHSSFPCPNCGAEVARGRLACPECGSDANTGWKDDEEVEYQAVALPEDGAGAGSSEARPARSRSRAWRVAVLFALVLAVFLAVVLR